MSLSTEQSQSTPLPQVLYPATISGPHVVVFDPTGNLKEGTILVDNAANVARSKSVALLPVTPKEMERGGVHGYSKRSYGNGWVINSSIAGRSCPASLFIDPAFGNLHFVFLLQKVSKASQVSGNLRITSDTGQIGSFNLGVQQKSPALNLATLNSNLSADSWLVYGEAQLSALSSHQAGFMLYGTAHNAKVAWLAVSQPGYDHNKNKHNDFA